MLDLPEKSREISRERVDQVRDLSRLPVRFQHLAIFRNARQPETRQPVVEPRAYHFLLFLPQMNATLVIDQLTDELIVGIGDLHGNGKGLASLSVCYRGKLVSIGMS